MKSTKKVLAVLLAAVMLLSCSTLAFATDEAYTWTRIPTSASSIYAGSYYLDWSPIAAQLAANDPDHTAADYLAILNAGVYYIDYDKLALKGTYTYPTGFIGNEAPMQMTLEAEDGSAYLPEVLNQSGLVWKPVAMSPEGLSTGDYYFDMAAMAQGMLDIEIKSMKAAYAEAYPDAEPLTTEEAMQAILDDMIADGTLPDGAAASDILPVMQAQMQQEFADDSVQQAYYYNPDTSNKLFRLKLVITSPESYKLIYPLAFGTAPAEDSEDYESYEIFKLYCSCIKQVPPPPEQEDNTEPQPDLIAEAFVKIMAFLAKIRAFFRNLFTFAWIK